MKGLKIRKDITCSELVSILHQQLNIDPYLFDIHIKCCYNLLVQVPPINIVDDEDLSFFLEESDASRMPLFVSVTPHERHGVDDMHQECNPTVEAFPSIPMYDFPPHLHWTRILRHAIWEMTKMKNGLVHNIILTMCMDNVQNHKQSQHPPFMF